MMYGVVLWSNCESTKAVIWCEDQGDLAFFADEDTGTPLHMGPGDLVQFEMRTESQLRYAHNPRLVQEGACAGIDSALASTPDVDLVPPKPQPRASAEIIPIDFALADRKKRASDDAPIAASR